MNTETIELITGIVEELIAAIPQIVVVLTTVVYSLNAIKSKVNSFPIQMKETKETVDTNLKNTQVSINESLQQSKKEINEVVIEMREKILENVSQTLVSMEKELVDYKRDLKSNSDQVNMLVRQNKVFTDVITALVADDPKKVVDGVAKIVTQRTNMSKQDLENYPQLLIKELPKLEGALKEAFVVLGKEKFDELLGKIGYGKDH
jgi:hypothetical protein